MNVEIGNDATQFLFWEYLFRIFSIVSLQCIELRYLVGKGDWLKFSRHPDSVADPDPGSRIRDPVPF
jgi:hypothetical protein